MTVNTQLNSNVNGHKNSKNEWNDNRIKRRPKADIQL